MHLRPIRYVHRVYRWRSAGVGEPTCTPRPSPHVSVGDGSTRLACPLRSLDRSKMENILSVGEQRE
jgi:hypothetical protein